MYKNKVVGYFDGRMEFSPRALGSRSILGNPLDPEMQSKLNLKIKYREFLHTEEYLLSKRAEEVLQWVYEMF